MPLGYLCVCSCEVGVSGFHPPPPRCIMGLAAARQCRHSFPVWKFTRLPLRQHFTHLFICATCVPPCTTGPCSHLLVRTTSPPQAAVAARECRGCTVTPSACRGDSLEVPGGFQVFGVIFERAVESQAVGRALHHQWAGGGGCRDQRMRGG